MPKKSARKWQILWMSKLRHPNRGHAGYREVRGLLREARAEHRQSSLQRQENLHRQSWSGFKHIAYRLQSLPKRCTKMSFYA